MLIPGLPKTLVEGGDSRSGTHSSDQAGEAGKAKPELASGYAFAGAQESLLKMRDSWVLHCSADILAGKATGKELADKNVRAPALVISWIRTSKQWPGLVKPGGGKDAALFCISRLPAQMNMR